MVAFSLMGTSMAMGDTSSDCGVLGVLASKIRVWRCVDILFVFFSVYSENQLNSRESASNPRYFRALSGATHRHHTQYPHVLCAGS